MKGAHKEGWFGLLQGVVSAKSESYVLHQVLFFSDEMKELLREELVSICCGASALGSGRSIYSYESVVGELVKRIESKNTDGRKGIIGELLVHLITKKEMPDKHAASLLFNLEESGYKKGFDLTLCDSDFDAVWFTETKAGEVSPASTPASAMKRLLGRAKRDLVKRLDGDNGFTLWNNAISHAERALSAEGDGKQAIVDILDELYAKSRQGLFDHTGASVILAAVVFDNRTSELIESDVRKSYEDHSLKDGFAKLMILVIQKATYTAVMDFLYQEAK